MKVKRHKAIGTKLKRFRGSGESLQYFTRITLFSLIQFFFKN
jgi:hypothetical protein